MQPRNKRALAVPLSRESALYAVDDLHRIEVGNEVSHMSGLKKTELELVLLDLESQLADSRRDSRSFLCSFRLLLAQSFLPVDPMLCGCKRTFAVLGHNFFVAKAKAAALQHTTQMLMSLRKVLRCPVHSQLVAIVQNV